MNSKQQSNSRPWSEKSFWSLATVTGGILSATVVTLLSLTIPASGAEAADVLVYKTPTCGCCKKWVDQLRDSGVEVDVVNVPDTRPIQSRVGVPRQLGSCHTAVAGDYWIEGHVPIDLVKKLLAEKPENIRGLAVRGMPPGSPGMESPNPVPYDVLAYSTEGKVTIHAKR